MRLDDANEKYECHDCLPLGGGTAKEPTVPPPTGGSRTLTPVRVANPHLRFRYIVDDLLNISFLLVLF